MKGTRNVALIGIAALVLILLVWGCSGQRALVKADEQVANDWNDVQAAYQNRADLVPNLVNTVKGAADFEKSTLTAVIEARAKATSINLTADQLTPENMQKFQDAQTQMTGALKSLLVTVEKYPDLKANQNFLDLQHKLDGIEGDIRNARMKFNKSVNTYNVKVRSFPNNVLAGMFGFSKKEGFKADEGAEKAPTVQF